MIRTAASITQTGATARSSQTSKPASRTLIIATSIASEPSVAVPEHDIQVQNNTPVPLAAIIGPILGAILVAIAAIFILFVLRRRKRMEIYRAATFPSPYVDTDMSGQLPGKYHIKKTIF